MTSTSEPRPLTRHARAALALGLIVCSWAFARLPEPSSAQRQIVARRFRFERLPIVEPPSSSSRTIRRVHPSLERISAWISAVGASVALNDIDGDGLPNDICLVDPRTDRVVVSPAGDARRYDAFELDLTSLVDPAKMAPMGCVPGDFDEDGHIDLLVYFWGRTPLIYLRRDGAARGGGYAPVPITDRDEAWFTNAVTRADVDGDGHPDVIVANYFPDGAAILDATGSGSETMQASMSRARNGGGKHLLLWSPAPPGNAVAFSEVPDAFPAEVAGGWTLALAAADLDRDLLPELYFANDFGPDCLLHNDSTPGRPHFTPLHGTRSLTTARSKVLGRDSFKGMGVDFGDVNHDGVPDIFVSNITSRYALEESNFLFESAGSMDAMRAGVAPFVDRSEARGLSRSGWAWDAKLDDFDNDGELEALQATGFIRGVASRWPELQELATANDQLLQHPRVWPRFQPGADLSGHEQNPFFVRAGDGRYYDVAAEVGLHAEPVSRGIAIADTDGDGLLDIAVSNQWSASSWFRNRAQRAGAFLGLRLLRPVSPRVPFSVAEGRQIVPGTTPAIGASAEVSVPGHGSMRREVDGGNGHSGRRSDELHFGLGSVSPTAALHVEFRWRDARGSPQRREAWLTPGRHVVVLGASESGR